MSNHVTLNLRPTKSLQPPPIILRRHGESKMQKLQKSIERFGVVTPVLVDAQGQIVDGVARYLAAMAVGLQQIPVIEVSNLNPVELRVLRLALNRLQEEAKWDPQALANELSHLMEFGIELDYTAFNIFEIENLLVIGEPPGDVEDLDTALIARPIVSRSGDTWMLRAGKMEHRVACGDCLNEPLRKKLFEAELAAVCFTDPPYNVPVRGHVSGTGRHAEFAMASGEMTDREFEDFLQKLLEVIKA